MISGVKNENSSTTYTLEQAVEEASKCLNDSFVLWWKITSWLFISLHLGMGKCQIVLTFLTALSVLGSSIENTNISYILPYAKCDLEPTAGEQGLLSAISYLGIVFTSHCWGFLADTWGRQKVLRVAATGAFIFSFSSAFAINTISMIVLRFLAGAWYLTFCY